MEVLDNESMQTEVKFASSSTRFGNLVLDGIALYVVSVVVGFIPFIRDATILFKAHVQEFSSTMDFNTLMDAYVQYLWIAFPVNFLIHMAYYVTMEASTGKTLGKMITKTKVVGADGGQAGVGAIIIRSLCRYIPLEAFSYLSNSVGWHDRISKTRVIVDQPITGVGY